MTDCFECADISMRKERPESPKAWAIQCDECGRWWRFTFSFGLPVKPTYEPVLCKQKGCTEQAVFKDQRRGVKRRWKCRAHAGECIIA